MSYVIIEPFYIKIRRAIAKLSGKKDPVVEEFDKQAAKAFFASHGQLPPKQEKTGKTTESDSE